MSPFLRSVSLSSHFLRGKKGPFDLSAESRLFALHRRFTPKYFDPDISDGRPKLTEEGKRVIQLELEGDGY